jgi:hypothetical protein
MNRSAITILDDDPETLSQDVFRDEKSFSVNNKKKRWNRSLLLRSAPIILLAGHVTLSTLNFEYSQDRNRRFFRTQVSVFQTRRQNHAMPASVSHLSQ